jgi:hypothetical protein
MITYDEDGFIAEMDYEDLFDDDIDLDADEPTDEDLDRIERSRDLQSYNKKGYL